MVTRPTNRIDAEIRLITVTQKQMSKALGLGTTRINQLVDEGILVRDETSRSGQLMLFESLQNFFLSRGTGSTDESVNFWKERGLHERAKRELAEVKLAKTRGELYESSIVEQTLSEILTNFRTKLLGLPSKYAPRLVKKTRGDIYKTLTGALEELLTELADELEGVNFEDETSSDADSVEVNPPDN